VAAQKEAYPLFWAVSRTVPKFSDMERSLALTFVLAIGLAGNAAAAELAKSGSYKT